MKDIIPSYVHHKLLYRTILALSIIQLFPNNVLSQINADFAANETNVCSGSSLVFTDLSTGVFTDLSTGITPSMEMAVTAQALQLVQLRLITIPGTID